MKAPEIFRPLPADATLEQRQNYFAKQRVHIVGANHGLDLRYGYEPARGYASVRNCALGSGAIGTTEPFDAVGRLLPTGLTKLAGGGPSHGPSTRAS